jgi:hypothetical protein
MQDAIPLVQERLGSTWHLWFDRSAGPDSTFPRQAVVFLAKATLRIKDNYDKSKLAENAADAKRVADLGLSYRASPGETQGARATPAARPDPGDGTGEDTGDGSASTDPATEQE